LGFRVDHARTYVFRQVVTNLVQRKETDISLRYNSLRYQDVVGDFQFVLLNSTLPYAQSLNNWQRLVEGLRWLGASQQGRFGLNNPLLTLENAPLLTFGWLELPLPRINFYVPFYPNFRGSFPGRHRPVVGPGPTGARPGSDFYDDNRPAGCSDGHDRCAHRRCGRRHRQSQPQTRFFGYVGLR